MMRSRDPVRCAVSAPLRALAIPVLAAGIGTFACMPPADTTREQTAVVEPAAPDSVRDEVLAVIEQYYADLSARDWDRVRGHFWPHATLATIWQPPGEPSDRVVTTTIEEFIEQAPQGPGSRSVFAEEMTAAHVRGDDQLAQVWAYYDARFGDPGDMQEWSGIDAFTLIRFDARWRITAMAYLPTGGGPR